MIKNRYLNLFCFLFLFISMYIMNFLTPMFADDYNYSYMWDKSKRIESLIDIFRSQVMHYFQWGGRTIAHTIGQILLMTNKYISSLLNTLAFIVLIYFIYWHSMCKRMTLNSNFFIFLLITFFCWTSIPNFGETTIWIIGSVNYLWTSVIILAFLIPYRLKMATHNVLTDSPLIIVGMFILGLLAGWTNENTALSGIVLTLILLIYFKLKKLNNVWMFTGLVGSIIGFSLLIFAPGNLERASLIQKADDYSFVLYHIKIPIMKTIQIMLFQSPLWVSLIIILTIFITKNIKNKIMLRDSYNKYRIELNYSFLLISLSFLNNLLMFASPTFPLRAGFGSSIFLMIGILNLLKIDLIKEIFDRKWVLPKLIIGLFLAISMGMVIKQYYQLNEEYKSRLEIINEHKEKGHYSVDIPPYTINFSDSYQSYYGHVFVSDIGENPYIWPNDIYAKYYGLDSVKILSK